MAIWDIAGKVLGQPVWNLLGGRFRDRIRVYGHARTPERARKLPARGYTGHEVSFTGAVDLDALAAVREAPGLGVDLVLEEIARHPSRRNVTDLPPDDGGACEPGTVGESVYFQTRLQRRRKLRGGGT